MLSNSNLKKINYIYSLLLVSFFFFASGKAISQTTASKDYFAIESYYKVKWGYADEFIELWKKNHYPLLKKAQEKGDVLTYLLTVKK